MKIANRWSVLILTLLVALGYSFPAYGASVSYDRSRAYSDTLHPHLILGGGKSNTSEGTFARLSVTGDGSKLVFIQDFTLYLYNRATDTSEPIYKNGMLYDATISLDGSTIVFKDNSGGTYKLLSYKVASKELTTLSTSTKSFYGFPALSADGSLVSYARYNGTKYVGILQNTVTQDQTVLDPAKLGKHSIDINSDTTAAPVIVSHDGKSVYIGTYYDSYTNLGYIFKYDVAGQTFTQISGGQNDAIHLGYLNNDDSKLFGMYYDSSRYYMASQSAAGGTKQAPFNYTDSVSKLRGINGDGSVWGLPSVVLPDYTYALQFPLPQGGQQIGGSSDGRILFYVTAQGIAWVDISDIKDHLPSVFTPAPVYDLTVTTSSSGVNTLKWMSTLMANYDDTIYRDGVSIGSIKSSYGTFKDTAAAPGTTYTYRVKAANSAGGTLGNAVTVTTGGIMAPANVKATPTSRTTVDITADAVPQATGYKLTVNGVTQDSKWPSFTASGLTASTSYTATLVAYTTDATSANSSVSFKTPATDPIYTAPSGLFVMDQTATSIQLQWSDVSGATGYTVKRGSTVVYEGTGTSYTDTGLTPATSYLYSVVAKFGSGTSAAVSAVGKTTAAPVLQAPANLKAAWVEGKVVLSFDAVSGATSYTVKRGDATISSNADRTMTDAAASQPGTTYTYTVTATDGTSTSSASSTSITVPTKLAAPTGFQVVTNAFNHVYLVWDKMEGMTYTLKSQGKTLSQKSNADYDDLSVQPQTAYTYELTASKGSQTSDPVTVSVTTPAETIAYPKNLTVTEATYTLVRLKWSPVQGAEGYDVYRNNMLYGTVTDPTFTDERVYGGSSNVYGIKAHKGSLSSEAALITVNVPKQPVQGEAPAAPTGLKAVQIAAGYIKLQALTVTDATYYEFYRDDHIKIASGFATAIKDDTVAPQQTYTYTVYAGNEFGRTKGDTITITTPAEAPVMMIQPSKSTENYTITFNFKTVADADTYYVERNPRVTYTKQADGSYHKTYYNTVTKVTEDLGTVRETNGLLEFEETGVTPATKYQYNITAVKTRGGVEEVIGGNEVSVTTPADGSPATIPADPNQPSTNPQPGSPTSDGSGKENKKSSDSTTSAVAPLPSAGSSLDASSTPVGGGGAASGAQASGSQSDSSSSLPTGSSSAPQIAFTDVQSGSFAAAAIGSLAKDGIIQGYADRSFRPDQPVTRAEFAVLMTRAFHLTSDQGYQHRFSDVDPVAWYARELAIALNTGVTKGYDSTRYAPQQLIPREQAAIMLTNVLYQRGMLPVTDYAAFRDSSAITVWARVAVSSAVGHQIMKGYPDGFFKPHQHVTRAEAAQMIFVAKQH